MCVYFLCGGASLLVVKLFLGVCLLPEGGWFRAGRSMAGRVRREAGSGKLRYIGRGFGGFEFNTAAKPTSTDGPGFIGIPSYYEDCGGRREEGGGDTIATRNRVRGPCSLHNCRSRVPPSLIPSHHLLITFSSLLGPHSAKIGAQTPDPRPQTETQGPDVLTPSMQLAAGNRMRPSGITTQKRKAGQR